MVSIEIERGWRFYDLSIWGLIDAGGNIALGSVWWRRPGARNLSPPVVAAACEPPIIRYWSRYYAIDNRGVWSVVSACGFPRHSSTVGRTRSRARFVPTHYYFGATLPEFRVFLRLRPEWKYIAPIRFFFRRSSCRRHFIDRPVWFRFFFFTSFNIQNTVPTYSLRHRNVFGYEMDKPDYIRHQFSLKKKKWYT